MILQIFILIFVVALLNKYILQYRLLRMFVCVLAFHIFNDLNLIAFRDVTFILLIVDFIIFSFKFIFYVIDVLNELKNEYR